MKNEMKIEFMSKSTNEAFARIAVAAFVAQLDPTIEEISDIKTAVSEAVTNAIIHGYEEKGGKIKMAAYWDFDLAFGNFSHDNKNYDDLATYGSDDKDAYVSYNWCTYLFRDEEFCERFKERWNAVRELILRTTDETIDKYVNLLNGGSQQQNFTVWDVWDKRAGFQSKWCSAENTFEKQLKYLENFVLKRADFIDKTIPKLPFSE